MRMSEHGLELLTQWEGFETSAYLDSGGKLTIGVGHLLTAAERSSGTVTIDGVPVAYGGGLSRAQVTALLRQDLTQYEAAVNEHVTVGLAQNQFDALVSFTFNVGKGALASSTLLKRVNALDFDDVPNQLRKWNKVNDQVIQGLVNRREN